MIAQSEIREKISRYLRQEVSLDQFEDWLVQHSWNMHQDSDDDAQKLAASVELRLAERSSGHLNESELREELRSLLNVFPLRIDFKLVPVSVPDEPKFFQINKAMDDVLPVFMISAPIQMGSQVLACPASVPVGT